MKLKHTNKQINKIHKKWNRAAGWEEVRL